METSGGESYLGHFFIFCTHHQHSGQKKSFAIPLSFTWSSLCHAHGAEALVLNMAVLMSTAQIHSGLRSLPTHEVYPQCLSSCFLSTSPTTHHKTDCHRACGQHLHPTTLVPFFLPITAAVSGSLLTGGVLAWTAVVSVTHHRPLYCAGRRFYLVQRGKGGRWPQ